MKIFRICMAPGHVQRVRNRYGLDKKKIFFFDKQLDIYRAENLVLPGGWAAAMKAEGFQVFETVFNDYLLQARWARENDLTQLSFEDDFLVKVLLAQVRKFKPDVLFIYAGAFFLISRVLRTQLRAAGPPGMIMTGFWGDELLEGRYTYSGYFGDLDFVFVSSPIYQEKFREAGIDAHMIGNAFDPSIKYNRDVSKKHDVVFCGTSGFRIPEHLNRFQWLKALIPRTPLAVFSNEPMRQSLRLQIKNSVFNFAEGLPSFVLRVFTRSKFHRVRYVASRALRTKTTGVSARHLAIDGHPKLWLFERERPLRSLFRRRIFDQPLLTADYHDLLASSRIVLNIHRDEDADIGNIRVFEATGVGSVLLTDRGEALKIFFDVENEIVTFNSVDECVEKINFLLANPDEMARIAANGQRATLERHTVGHRCKAIAEILLTDHTHRASSRSAVMATYDLDRHPISFDFAFFLQAAEVYRKQMGAERLFVVIIPPTDLKNQPGVSAAVDAIVDQHARQFRISHICLQLSDLTSATVIYLKDRDDVERLVQQRDIIPFPNGGIPHHSEYYRIVNNNPSLVTGFSASIEAKRFVKTWLSTFAGNRKVICVTLRQYLVDTERNSNVREWAAFLKKVDMKRFAVVILPDTDHINEFKKSELKDYPYFEPACFDVDLRMAMYEAAYLNMFVNNGPSVAATLNNAIRYLMFKIMLPKVPTCTEYFLRWMGFEIGKTPHYGGKFKKWVWERDDRAVLWREFTAMCDFIDANSSKIDPDADLRRAAQQHSAFRHTRG